MGLNPLLANGKLPAGQGVTNTNVAQSNQPTAQDIINNSEAGAKAEAKLKGNQLYAAHQRLTAAQQQMTTQQGLATAGRRKLSSAQTQLAADQAALHQAQQTAASAVSDANKFNRTLATTIHQEYVNEYANDVDEGRITNTKINLKGIINPTAVYNQMAVKGSGVSQATTNTSLANSGITFSRGQPIISSNLQTSAAQSVMRTGGATTGAVNNQRPSSVPVR